MGVHSSEFNATAADCVTNARQRDVSVTLCRTRYMADTNGDRCPKWPGTPQFLRLLRLLLSLGVFGLFACKCLILFTFMLM